ncbi:MAG: hypothetical protein ABIP35_07355 [Ginsengibacter sp.]
MILIVLMFFCGSVGAQDRIRQISCFDSTLKKEADSIKLNLARQGFIVVREATMTMESEYEMPVVVPLNEGSMYQFVFIGDLSSKLYEIRMYDFNEKQVVYQKKYGDGMESNMISYAYIPRATEYHVIKPVQVAQKKKTKTLCGYIIMFKKVK